MNKPPQRLEAAFSFFPIKTEEINGTELNWSYYISLLKSVQVLFKTLFVRPSFIFKQISPHQYKKRLTSSHFQ